MNNKLVSLILVLQFSILNAWYINVVPTQEQKEVIQSLQIDKISHANFGRNPYGKILEGPVIYLNSTECSISEPIDLQSLETSPIYLVDRGECSFVDKAKNVQELGGQAVIIIDDNYDEDVQDVIMGDDGKGEALTLPSIMISKEAGEQIKELLNKIDDEDLLKIQIDFDSPKRDKANVQVFLQLSDQYSREIIFGLKRRFDILKDHMELKVFYFFFTLNEYVDSASDLCLYDDNGKIWVCCEGIREYNNLHAGRERAKEQLNQLCIKKIYGDYMYFEYMQQQYESCFQVPTYDHCRKLLFKLLDIDNKKISQCTDVNLEQTQEMIKEQFAATKQFYQVNAKINGEKYFGSFYFDNFASAICAGLTNPPEECETKINNGIFMRQDSNIDKEGSSSLDDSEDSSNILDGQSEGEDNNDGDINIIKDLDDDNKGEN